MKPIRSLLLAIAALLVGAASAHADFMLVDKNGKYVGHMPDPTWGYFFREMEKRVWVQFNGIYPGSINTPAFYQDYWYTDDSCSGTPLVPFNEGEFFRMGYVIGTNEAGTRGQIIYPIGPSFEATPLSRKIGEECVKLDPGSYGPGPFTRNFKTVNINRWRLEAPFRIENR